MPSRRFTTMEKWLFKEINPSSPAVVKYNEKVSKYFNNSASAVIAFLDKLNTDSKFTDDGLELLPGDLTPDPLVRQLLAAIADDYLRRGWSVT